MRWTIQVQDGPVLAPLPATRDFLLLFSFEFVKSSIEHHGTARLQAAPFAVRVVLTSREHPHDHRR